VIGQKYNRHNTLTMRDFKGEEVKKPKVKK